MSFVHDMLCDIEQKEDVALRAPTSVKAGLFVLDMPNEIVSDFYDLKEHVRIANVHGRVNTLAIADSSQGEGSSTIATFLAFLLGGGLTPTDQSKNKSRSQKNLVDLKRSDQIFTSDFCRHTRRATTDDVFSDWNTSIDARFAYANTHESILLVDANLHEPSIHRYFGLSVENGLAEIVEQRTAWQRLVRPVRDSRLQVVTTGNSKMNPVELLGSDVFRALVKEWKREYRYVIFNSPAVLNYTDALSVASVVDGVVLVVKAGQTRWDSAQQAKQKLTAARANLLGVTLNRRKMDIPDGLYKNMI